MKTIAFYAALLLLALAGPVAALLFAGCRHVEVRAGQSMHLVDPWRVVAPNPYTATDGGI